MQISTTRNAADDTVEESLVGVPSHPVAAVAGAVLAGGATGAVVGTAAGPVGTVIGAVAGAIAGALGGDAIAASFSDAADDAHWRDHYSSRPYVSAGSSYDDYGPAYAYGSNARSRYPDGHFDEVEGSLGSNWGERRGNSRLEWDEAKLAARDAWDRFDDPSRSPSR